MLKLNSYLSLELTLIETDALFLGVFLQQLEFLNSVQEVQSGVGVLDVLDTQVDTLWHNAVAHLLVDDDTDGMRGDVEHSTGLTVVELVGHTLLNGAVTLEKNYYELEFENLFSFLHGRNHCLFHA